MLGRGAGGALPLRVNTTAGLLLALLQLMQKLLLGMKPAAVAVREH